MSKRKDKLAVKDAKQFFGIAEKVVDGLVESKACLDEGAYLFFHEITKVALINAIAEAMKKNLTYGNLATMTLRNNKGQITAKLYIMPDGTLADDSWLCNKGWK